MTTPNRLDWIATLKVGDLVAIQHYGPHMIWHRIGVITNITTDGSIRVSGQTFGPDGCASGIDLVPVTLEIKRAIRAELLRSMLGNYRWDLLTDDQTIAVLEALKTAGIVTVVAGEETL